MPNLGSPFSVASPLVPVTNHAAFQHHTYLFFSSLINSGEAVAVEDEVVVVNCIVLPNKTLNVSVQEEIIL